MNSGEVVQSPLWSGFSGNKASGERIADTSLESHAFAERELTCAAKNRYAGNNYSHHGDKFWQTKRRKSVQCFCAFFVKEEKLGTSLKNSISVLYNEGKTISLL